MNNQKIFKRIISEQILRDLKIFGGVIIRGARFVGKTTLCQKYAQTALNLINSNDLAQAKLNFENFVMNNQKPILIDEWQIWPDILPRAKTIIDQSEQNGLFLLTGSIWLNYRNITDPGIGRFSSYNLRPLSLFEIEESEQLISLNKLVYDNQFNYYKIKNPFTLEQLIDLVCRGGFPKSVLSKYPDYLLWNQKYIYELLQFTA